MIDIHISHTGTLFGRKAFSIHRSIPESWGEMDPPAVWKAIDHLITSTDRAPLIRDILNIPPLLLRRIHHGEMYDIIRTLDWMQIDQTSTAPAAPYIATPGCRLYLPCESWANVVGMEYALIDDMYHSYIDADASSAPAIQDDMLSIMLRPAGPSDDPYSDPRTRLVSLQQTHQWRDQISAMPIGIKAYMTLFISANIQFLHDTYGTWLFAKAEDPSDTSSVSASTGTGSLSGGLNFGWWGSFMDIAADGLFGDLDRVHQTPIHTICMHLCRKVDEARRLKAQQDAIMARSRR